MNMKIHQSCEIHPSVSFGENFTAWQFSTIGENTSIGDDVVVGSNVWIGKNCTIGKGTRIQHGVFIPHATRIGGDVFIGPNVTLTDDKHPQARKSYTPAPPILKHQCSLGAGCVILPGVTIGERAMIGAGAVVVDDVPDDAVMIGIPARQYNL